MTDRKADMVRKRSIEKRSILINTALKLFVEKGFQNTSTAEIAREAGTAAGTLFIYFPTKQDLINELALKVAREYADFIGSSLDPSLSARDTFQAIWNGTIYWFLKEPLAYRFAQILRAPGVVPDVIVMETGKNFSFYFDAIQKGLQEGSIKAYPIEMIGGFLYQDFIAMMNFISTQSDTSKQGETIQQGFELFWDGIKI